MFCRVSLIVSGLAMMSLGLGSCDDDSQSSPPRISEEAKAYADAHWTNWDGGFGSFWEQGIWLNCHMDYEYYAASFFGMDGDDATQDDNFMGTIEEWSELPWGPVEGEDRLDYLPEDGFTHHADYGIRDDQFYEFIGLYDQFGAGWPADGDLPLPEYEGTNPAWDYRDMPHENWMWEAENSYRNTYLNMIGGGGN
jgi:hypothetical protein